VIARLRGIAALAGLTLREATRQRLWLVFVAIGVGFLLAVPRLTAVDDAAKLKLSVLAITTGIGFVITLMAVLVAAAALRRDLDAKTAYTLFAKPLTPTAYLLGRWTGVQLWLVVGVLAMALAGVAAIGLQFQRFPTMRQTALPASWQQVSAVGEATAVEARKTRLSLSGMPGNGVRWRFTDVPVAPSEGHELLLRAQVLGTTPDQASGEALVEIRALVAGGTQVLPLDPLSPYGRTEDRASTGRVLLKHRDNSSRDLGQDYLRLRLPSAAIQPDGSATIQLIRLEARTVVVFDREDGLLIGRPAGTLFGNLLRGGLVLAAGAGLLAAWALFCAVVSNLGVTLLGGLTLFFAGSTLDMVRETLEYENPSLGVRRLLELALVVMPDFNRFPIATDLAAGQGVAWATVGSAWIYYGGYGALFLVCAWIALRRKEL